MTYGLYGILPWALERNAHSAVLKSSINANQILLVVFVFNFSYHLPDFLSSFMRCYEKHAEVSNVIVDLFMSPFSCFCFILSFFFFASYFLSKQM